MLYSFINGIHAFLNDKTNKALHGI